MQVNYNISAMIANNALNTNDNRLADSIERLSSGLKIANAKDNPSGLAMSRRMNAQIRGLKQSVNNASDGISIMSTADGALTEVHEILQRMSELAIQATNGTNSDNDRKTIQDEIIQLKEEISRIAETTQFNGQNLLDGTFDLRGYATVGDAVAGENVTDPKVIVNDYASSIEPGYYVIEGITADFNERIGQIDIKDMGSEYIKVYKYDPVTNKIDKLTPYMNDARMIPDGDLLRMETKDGRFIELRIGEVLENATINLNLTGKGDMTLQIGANEGVTLNARIPTVSLQNLGLTYLDYTRTIVDDVEANVTNLTTGDRSGNTPYYDVWLGSKYSTNYYYYYKTIEDNTSDFYKTQDYLDKMQKYSDILNEYYDGYGIQAYKDLADDISAMLKGQGVDEPFPNTGANLDKQAIVSTFVEKYLVAYTQQNTLDSYNLDEYSDTLARDIYTILTTDFTGVTPKDESITIETSAREFLTVFNKAEELYEAYKGESFMDKIEYTGDVRQDIENLVDFYGLTKADLDNLKNKYDDGTLTGEDVDQIINTAKSNFLTQEESNLVASKAAWDVYLSYADYLTQYKDTLDPDNKEEKEIIDEIVEMTDAIARIDAEVDGYYNPIPDSEKVLHFAQEYYIDEDIQKTLDRIMAKEDLTDLKKGRKLYDTLHYSKEKGIIAPNTGADQAIRDVGNAIQKVSNIRSRLGAYQNRLEHTVKSNNIVDENMTAAYSRIMDVDMADEMTVYSTQQVLSQAGTTMLAQANERPSQVLQLLQR